MAHLQQHAFGASADHDFSAFTSGDLLQINATTDGLDPITGSASETLYHDGTNWVTSSVLQNDGSDIIITSTLLIGSGSIAADAILELDATNKAFLLTRVSDPSGDISTPINGMIAYDSTDDELQAYISGSWVNIGGGGNAAFSTSFSTTAGVPLNIVHNLDTQDIVYSIREGNDFIDAEVTIVDNDNITIETTSNINGDVTIVAVGGVVGGGSGISIGDNISGGSTAGSILFVSGAQQLTQDNANLFWDDTNDALGIGTNSIAADAILELSAPDKALLITRLSDPSSDITSPTNGMITYDSTDDELQAYIGGSWVDIGGAGASSSGVSGAVQFSDGTGGFSSDENNFFWDDVADSLGIGTNSIAADAILELSATDKALLITRVSDPSSDISTPVNGMIAYDSTDDELQAYINGSWTQLGSITSPGGADTQVQFNDSSSFNGDSNFVWDNINKTLALGTTATTDRLTIRGISGQNVLLVEDDGGTDLITIDNDTGQVTIVNQLDINGGQEVRGVESETTLSSTSGTLTWDVAQTADGLNAEISLTENVTTFTINNVTNGMIGVIRVIQGAGSYTMVLPASSLVVDNGGGSYTPTTTNGAIDILTFYYDGTNFHWNIGQNYT